ncbi:hypothetical protein [Arsenophonus nasoniae]|uniref:hypothetical protein n=1 Tax=Arsenophonus nasoniae TaxID=638 RepID=UPI00387A3E21
MPRNRAPLPRCSRQRRAYVHVKGTITAPQIAAQQSLTVGNIDVGNHTHGGVETGNGSTGKPK